MLGVEVEDEFQTAYLELLTELDHLHPDVAQRLAFNLAMDRRWERIEHRASHFLESEASLAGDPPTAWSPDKMAE
jgi:hypothetical protein